MIEASNKRMAEVHNKKAIQASESAKGVAQLKAATKKTIAKEDKGEKAAIDKAIKVSTDAVIKGKFEPKAKAAKLTQKPATGIKGE